MPHYKNNGVDLITETAACNYCMYYNKLHSQCEAVSWFDLYFAAYLQD